MARSRSRLAWILVLIGLLVLAIAGMWLFMSVAASVLHPTPQAISSVTHTDLSPVRGYVGSCAESAGGVRAAGA
jgi:flagellar basal body-associated protein FliL